MRPASLAYLLLVLALEPAFCANGQTPPSRPGVDAPELAALGPHGVGVRSIVLVEPGVPDVLAYDRANNILPRKDRGLDVEVWYPAKRDPAVRDVVYADSLPAQAKGQVVPFSQPGPGRPRRRAGRRELPTGGDVARLQRHAGGDVVARLRTSRQRAMSSPRRIIAIRRSPIRVGSQSLCFCGPSISRSSPMLFRRRPARAMRSSAR